MWSRHFGGWFYLAVLFSPWVDLAHELPASKSAEVSLQLLRAEGEQTYPCDADTRYPVRKEGQGDHYICDICHQSDSPVNGLNRTSSLEA